MPSINTDCLSGRTIAVHAPYVRRRTVTYGIVRQRTSTQRVDQWGLLSQIWIFIHADKIIRLFYRIDSSQEKMWWYLQQICERFIQLVNPHYALNLRFRWYSNMKLMCCATKTTNIITLYWVDKLIYVSLLVRYRYRIHVAKFGKCHIDVVSNFNVWYRSIPSTRPTGHSGLDYA